MDFFDKDAHLAHPSATVDAAQFAEALQRRDTFVVPAPSPRMLQALSRTAMTQSQLLAPRPLPVKPPPPAPATSQYTPLQPEHLPPLLSNQSTLILDIRPHNSWKTARVRRAINLAVPSTLLRRPNFSLDKLAQMLPNAVDQDMFRTWSTATAIVVYDADSTALTESSNVVSLLNKLKASGFAGDLSYLYGGFNSVLLSAIPDLVDTSSQDAAADEQSTPQNGQYLSVRSLSTSAFQQVTTTGARQRPNVLAPTGATGAPGPSSTRKTAANPFYDNIRQHTELAGGITERIPLHVPRRILKRKDQLPFEWLRNIAHWAGAASNPPVPSGSNASLRTSLDTSSGVQFSLKQRSEANMNEGTEALAMQFYRIELGEQRRLQGVMDHHSRESSQPITKGLTQQVGDVSGGRLLPLDPGHNAGEAVEEVGFYPFQPSIVCAPLDSRSGGNNSSESTSEDSPRTTALGKAGPSVRVAGTEATVPNDIIKDPNVPYFPFSITAGVEKGHKNRYRNIWPFDHARVRLRTKCIDDGSDYVNASYVQPRGTHRNYIATQGPLPSTFRDFWTLVWEQNVRIIVMLTKCVEAHHVKCGVYWRSMSYGPLQVELVGEEGENDILIAEDCNETANPVQGFDFSSKRDDKKSAKAKKDMRRQLGAKRQTAEPRASGSSSLDTSSEEEEAEDFIIKRVFHLSLTNDPNQPKRTVVQLQYVGWPDVNIPRSPKHLLKLIAQVNELYECYQTTGSVDRNDADLSSGIRNKPWPTSPILVHCSAGVGRTGSFVLVDSILDAIRRETRQLAKMGKLPRANRYSHRRTRSSSVDVDVEMTIESSVAGNAAAEGILGGYQIPPPPSSGVSNGPASNHASRISPSSLPPMAALSMESLSSSPPKQPSMVGSNPSMQPSIVPTLFSPYTSPLPSAHGNPATGQAGGTASYVAVTPGASLASSTKAVAGSATAGTAEANTSFDFMTPREIRIPRHSRKYHPRAQFSSLATMDEDSGEQMEWEQLAEEQVTPPERDPSPLSRLQEPIREVLEGMREQRMSLCQSLRQYVFVHRAILEGAMDIVDEIHAEMSHSRGHGETVAQEDESENHDHQYTNHPPPATDEVMSPPSTIFPQARLLPQRLATTTDSLRPSSSGLGNKRLASPTELLRTDAQGQHTIHKRPSLKRINKSSELPSTHTAV